MVFQKRPFIIFHNRIESFYVFRIIRSVYIRIMSKSMSCAGKSGFYQRVYIPR